jgi:hypothetical protein
MLERREARRIDFIMPVIIRMDDLEVKSRMINYSDDGALFRVEPSDRDKVSTEILGKDADFLLKVKNKPERKYTGEVIRFYVRGIEKYFALRFWEPYRELR